MEVFLLPVPLWVLLLVTAVIAVLFDFQSRRNKRRIDSLERVISNMDRWADDIEARLESCEKSSSHSQYVTGYRHFANNERFKE